MSSKQSDLCVNRSRNIDTLLFRKAAIFCNFTQENDNKII